MLTSHVTAIVPASTHEPVGTLYASTLDGKPGQPHCLYDDHTKPPELQDNRVDLPLARLMQAPCRKYSTRVGVPEHEDQDVLASVPLVPSPPMSSLLSLPRA